MGRTANLTTADSTQGQSLYMSPKALMQRWQCSRTQVDRIARREGLRRMLFGTGRNGMVRYVRAEIEAMEAKIMMQG